MQFADKIRTGAKRIGKGLLVLGAAAAIYFAVEFKTAPPSTQGVEVYHAPPLAASVDHKISYPHLTDLHFCPGSFNESQLERAVKMLSAKRSEFPFVVVTGDLIDRQVKEPQSALETVCAQLARIGKPVYLITGDHDTARFTSEGKFPDTDLETYAPKAAAHERICSILESAKKEHPNLRPLHDKAEIDPATGLALIGIGDNNSWTQHLEKCAQSLKSTGYTGKTVLALAHNGYVFAIRDLALLGGHQLFSEYNLIVHSGDTHKGWGDFSDTLGLKPILGRIRIARPAFTGRFGVYEINNSGKIIETQRKGQSTEFADATQRYEQWDDCLARPAAQRFIRPSVERQGVSWQDWLRFICTTQGQHGHRQNPRLRQVYDSLQQHALSGIGNTRWIIGVNLGISYPSGGDGYYKNLFGRHKTGEIGYTWVTLNPKN